MHKQPSYRIAERNNNNSTNFLYFDVPVFFSFWLLLFVSVDFHRFISSSLQFEFLAGNLHEYNESRASTNVRMNSYVYVCVVLCSYRRLHSDSHSVGNDFFVVIFICHFSSGVIENMNSLPAQLIRSVSLSRHSIR